MEKPLHPDFQNIRAKDEQEFYKLAVDYFYPRCGEYRTGYHIIFFQKIDTVFQFTSYQYFEQKKEYKTFEDKLKSNQFRILFESNPEGILFHFVHSFLKVSELFMDTRMTLLFDFNQAHKEHVEKGIPYYDKRVGNFEEFFREIIRLAIQSGPVERPKKRLAS